MIVIKLQKNFILTIFFLKSIFSPFFLLWVPKISMRIQNTNFLISNLIVMILILFFSSKWEKLHFLWIYFQKFIICPLIYFHPPNYPEFSKNTNFLISSPILTLLGLFFSSHWDKQHFLRIFSLKIIIGPLLYIQSPKITMNFTTKILTLSLVVQSSHS